MKEDEKTYPTLGLFIIIISVIVISAYIYAFYQTLKTPDYRYTPSSTQSDYEPIWWYIPLAL